METLAVKKSTLTINLLIPKTKAKVSLRLPPTEDPKHAMSMLEAHNYCQEMNNDNYRCDPGSGANANSTLMMMFSLVATSAQIMEVPWLLQCIEGR